MQVEEMVARYGTFNRLFQFHHTDPKEKNSDYTKIMRRVISAEQIEEVDKCALLCTECHGIVHAQDQQGTLTIMARIGDRRVSQRISGWYVIDRIRKYVTFISNERSLLCACSVRVGCETEKQYFMLELMQNELMMNWLRNIEYHKRIGVTCIETSKTLLKVVHDIGSKVCVHMALGVPIFALDMDVADGDSSCIWVRNGMVLTKEGEVLTTGVIEFDVDLTI